MNSELMHPNNLGNIQKILEFWHKVEFFIPFDLKKQVLEAKGSDWSVRYFTSSHLSTVTLDELWKLIPKEGKLSGFELYLGVFDKSELANITATLIRESLSQGDICEEKERMDLDGETCFARLKVNHLGEWLTDELSISTLPWAMGCIQRHGLTGLSFQAFQDGVSHLKDLLKNFQVKRASELKRISPESSAEADPLTGEDMLALLDIFYQWAGYEPKITDPAKQRAIVIRTKSIKSNKSPASPEEHAAEDDDEESEIVQDTEINILNSFYIKDIERAIHDVKAGRINNALANYLTPMDESRRCNLYDEEGRAYLARLLDPLLLNKGHWLDDKNHAMSMMQQFAINQTLQTLKNEGIFSVNGPPGTGKTTLLRDIFAENITNRARVLAGYSRVSDAFQSEKISVNFSDVQGSRNISILKPELTGYEMIVASSNNAAVENISRDLPKTASLGKHDWQLAAGQSNQVGYLQAIAHKIASQNNRGEFTTLPTHDVPWGLISCALGNQSNRNAFVSRFRLPGCDKNKPYPMGLKQPYPKEFSPEIHKSIWQWKEDYQGPSFAEAKSVFLDTDKQVSSRMAILQSLAELTFEMKGHTEDSYIQNEVTTIHKTTLLVQEANDAFESVKNELNYLNVQLNTLDHYEKTIKKQAPSWFSWLFRNEAYQKYKKDIDDCHAKQRQQLSLKIELQSKCRNEENNIFKISTQLHQAHQALENRKAKWQSLREKYQVLHQKFPQVHFPNDLSEIELDTWQKEGFWRDDKLNHLRSSLFAAALKLQEAWLSEVLSKGGGFSSNVIAFCDLLSGRHLEEAKHALPIWQSLFMVVPVISSTFASIASQFRDLGSNTLGWLFIDEAGQAIPQAAVGALWRSKRAIVVGDPLQIEPVFTVPIKLIEALLKSSNIPEHLQVSPHKVSVQSLADLANPYGATIAREVDYLQWIGSPLRVHRRCVYPMFDIANHIAYEDKMIYGLENNAPPKGTLDIGASAWVNVEGVRSTNQIVQEQIELVLKAFIQLYQVEQKFPPLYIISPFKLIKNEIVETLSELNHWKVYAPQYMPKKAELREWCRESIGTVHTFQGKENNVVWMVLGCDSNTLGAVSWAASKPNLLNVALTRAKHRFFMIGDVSIWSKQQYFDTAYTNLNKISPEEFLECMHTI